MLDEQISLLRKWVWKKSSMNSSSVELDVLKCVHAVVKSVTDLSMKSLINIVVLVTKLEV